MTEEISSDPESKLLGDEEPGAVVAQQQPAKSSDGGGDGARVSGDGGEERWKRERWTRGESMALVTAMKQLEEDPSTSSGGDAKWKSISQLCSTKGVQRTSVQCRKRWNTLLAAYRKIKDWQARNGTESYWAVSGVDFKAKKLPAGFDEEIWAVMNSFLAGRPGMSPRLFPYKGDDPASTANLPSGQGLQALPQPAQQQQQQALPQQTAQQSIPQPVQRPPQSGQPPLAQPVGQPSGQPLGQQPLMQPVPQTFTQPSPNERTKKDGPAARKRKRPGRQQQEPAPPPPVPSQQQVLKPPLVDEQQEATGPRSCAFEGIEPLTQFLSSFLEKSLESYERNSELNRKVRREQGEKLVAVISGLSSAVRDLVHSSMPEK